MIVIYSGHNDFSGFTSRSPRLLMFVERHGWWLVRAERLLARTRTYSMLAGRARLPLSPANDPGATRVARDLDETHRVILEEYTKNISSVIGRASAESRSSW